MTDEELKKVKSELRRKPYMTQYGIWKIRKGKNRVFGENLETHKFSPSFLYKELDKLLVFIDNIDVRVVPKEQSEEWQKGFRVGLETFKEELKIKMGEEGFNKFWDKWLSWG